MVPEISGQEYWVCPSCYEKVPYGFEHICPAKKGKDQPIPKYPTQLSLVALHNMLVQVLEMKPMMEELLKKLDQVDINVKEVKDKVKEKKNE